MQRRQSTKIDPETTSYNIVAYVNDDERMVFVTFSRDDLDPVKAHQSCISSSKRKSKEIDASPITNFLAAYPTEVRLLKANVLYKDKNEWISIYEKRLEEKAYRVIKRRQATIKEKRPRQTIQYWQI